MCTEITNQIKKYRKTTSTKQETLAKDVGITREYLSKIENGIYVPSSDLMIKICCYFKCDIGDMFSIKK